MMKYRVSVNNEVFEVLVEDLSGNMNMPSGQRAFQPQLVTTEKSITGQRPQTARGPVSPKSAAVSGRIQAPLPGVIMEIDVAVGQKVDRGDVLLILEAMKMENEVRSDISGHVKEILVEKGATVLAGAPLVVIE